MHLTVKSHRKPLPDGSGSFYGLCSNFLASQPVCDPTAAITCMPRTSTFRLPPNDSAPLIFLAAGTGFAPLRAMLQEREVALQRAGGAVGVLSPLHLFFGCMHEDGDWLYKDEIKHWADSGVITHLHTAFSHDQDERVFVQHKLWEHRAEMYRLLLDQDACVYVCGNANTM